MHFSSNRRSGLAVAVALVAMVCAAPAQRVLAQGEAQRPEATGDSRAAMGANRAQQVRIHTVLSDFLGLDDAREVLAQSLTRAASQSYFAGRSDFKLLDSREAGELAVDRYLVVADGAPVAGYSLLFRREQQTLLRLDAFIDPKQTVALSRFQELVDDPATEADDSETPPATFYLPYHLSFGDGRKAGVVLFRRETPRGTENYVQYLVADQP